jgi:hypothetical protein
LGVVLVALAGCGPRRVTVSGKVRYQAQAVPKGTVRFLTSEDKVLFADLKEDGSYTITGVPVGLVKISVTVPPAASLEPQQKGPDGRPVEGAAETTAVRVVPIPPIYSNPSTSGLEYTVTEEPQQTRDLDLP